MHLHPKAPCDMKQFIFDAYIIALFLLSQLSCFVSLPQACIKGIYYTFALLMTAFTLNRAGDESRDDYGYKTILCQNDEGDHKDIGWYYIIDLLGGGCDRYEPVIFFSSLVLAIKLLILPRLGHNVLPALFLYSSVYWELHDLTQLRLASSMLFVLIGLFFTTKNKAYARFLFFAIAGLFHIEALPLLIGDICAAIIKRVSPLYLTGCLFTLVGSNLLGLMPSGWSLYKISLEYPVLSNISKMLLSYSTLADINEHTTTSYPSIIIASYFMITLSLHAESHSNIYSRDIQYAIKSFIFGAFIVFIFSGMNDVMVRYGELYLVFIVFIIARIKRGLSVILMSSLGVMYFLKLNIFWRVMIWSD